MRLAILDMYYPFGHKSLNNSLVKILNSILNVVLLEYQDYYENITINEKSRRIKISKLFFVSRITLLKILCNCINLLIIKHKLRGAKYDSLLFMTYENISFSIMRFLFRNKTIYIIHHNNIDFLKSKKDFFFFKRYMNNVNHIVFADFIKEGLIDKTNVSPERIFTLEHPLSESITIDNNDSHLSVKKKVFIGLGLGSDENLISEIIQIDRERNYFENNSLKLILRSSVNNYESPGLKVFTGILPKDEYFELIKSSTAYLLLYPKTYQNRYSGSFLNALQSRKCVLATNIPVAKHFSKLYPNNISIIKNIDQLLTELTNSHLVYDNNEYQKFMKRHTNSRIQKQVKEIFNNKTKIV